MKLVHPLPSGRKTDGYGPREVWRPVVGFEGEFEVSNMGRVRSLDRTLTNCEGQARTWKGRVLRPGPSPSGHLSVSLKRKSHSVHVLVLEAFVGPRPAGMEACHWDDDPSNNRLDNLRWDSRSNNNRDRVRNGTHQMSKRTHCPHGHAYADWNLCQSTLRAGRRRCLACTRARRFFKKRKLPFSPELAHVKFDELRREHERRIA